MVKLVFENIVCKCTYNDSKVDERIDIKLSKPFNQLQIEERNCVVISLYECELFIRHELGYKVFATSFDNDSDEVKLSCFLKER